MVKLIVSTALTALFVFIVAGRVDYAQGWLFVGLNAATLLAAAAIFRASPGLLRERMSPGPGVPRWDVIWVSVLYKPAFYALIATACLDAGRYRWSPALPAPLYGAVVTACLVITGAMLRAVRENGFFSSMVRIQAERGHRVVTTGPYGVVRHPAYALSIVNAPACALLLGSFWALLPAAAVMALYVVRTVREDRFLRDNLPGYAEYAGRVKSMLVPGIF